MLNSKSSKLCYSQPDPRAVSLIEIAHGSQAVRDKGLFLSLEHSQTTVDVSPKGNITPLLVVS